MSKIQKTKEQYCKLVQMNVSVYVIRQFRENIYPTSANNHAMSDFYTHQVPLKRSMAQMHFQPSNVWTFALS